MAGSGAIRGGFSNVYTAVANGDGATNNLLPPEHGDCLPLRPRWAGSLRIVLVLSLVAASFAAVFTVAMLRHSRRQAASGPELRYPEWPPPPTNMSRSTLLALRPDRPGVARRLLALSRERQRAGLPPPVLVVAGGEWRFGLGNILTALASAAVLAESIGAACAFSLGEDVYSSELRPLLHKRTDGLPLIAFPCVEVGMSELGAIRTSRILPVVDVHAWRLQGGGGGAKVPPLGGGFIIDVGLKWHEEDCLTRMDVMSLLAPPGMAPAQFWTRLRGKFEETFAAIELPAASTAAERKIEAGVPPWLPRTGTVCGHIRLLHKENHRVGGKASCGRGDCGRLLAALEELYVRQPFGSYFFTSGADCTHCLPLVAPRLHSEAAHIESPHFSSRIDSPNPNVSVTDKFDNAVGAMLDLRALAKCALVLVDDKPAGTFAFAVAAAGRLTPCADPLEWLEHRPPGFEGRNKTAASYRLSDPNGADEPYPVRALCSTAEASSPPAPCANELTAAALGRLADDVRYDLATPWNPRNEPRLHSAHVSQFDTAECRRRTKLRVKELRKRRKADGIPT
ncbi:hypothetical protein T492DRAFT_987548 [Pavlovales sp. CCMP2436]|nr:hypothetical protein T492DRAFT_987548 [Pavlovales sp. CCMP2436]